MSLNLLFYFALGLEDHFHSLQSISGTIAENIRDALPRKMFGYDCIFVNGPFAAGLWQNTAVFKLSDADGARFVSETGAVPFSPMEGRLKGLANWWEASEELAHDGEQLAAWCAWVDGSSASSTGQIPSAKAWRSSCGDTAGATLNIRHSA